MRFPGPELDDYALLDSGGAEKLERFGDRVLRRPDPQAIWRPRLAPEAWASADLAFVRESDRGGRWEGRDGVPQEWPFALDGATVLVRPTRFKHVGVFPEQATNWTFAARAARTLGVERPRLLNLFGYTGVASVLALAAGYEVTHVDASRTSLAWALDNLALSGHARDAMRLLCDDALAFARREVRRGARYHGVLVDPPHYGRGPKGETWRFESGIASLMDAVGALLAERAFVVLSTYAIGHSPIALENLLGGLEGGAVEAGELVLVEAQGGRVLPAGACGRWWRGFDAR